MDTLHYNAFISYRHTPRDTEVAKELQQSLERFRIPKSIRTAYGKDRIDKVFRDQEDLEMTSDLSRKLDDALEASDFLIVVCSPDYVKSPWCMHELETFVERKGADRVLCVLSDGEPPEIFPDILLTRKETDIADDGTVFTRTVPAEPLACDFRGSFRQARRIELPRLVAAIIGCGYDELMLRQERYRRRRMATILTVTFCAAAVAISYLLWSNAQINRNFRQSQINESKMLSRESLSSLEGGDRYSALEKALEAVGNGDRPVVDDAVMALTSSSFAYTMPNDFLESWRIDTINDIKSFSMSDDGSYLAALDRLGTYHFIDLETREETGHIDLGPYSSSSAPVFGKDGDVFICVSGTVYAVSPQDGTVQWQIPLKYMLSNYIEMNSDKKLICAADSYAVQIMTSSGEPFLSLPLPEEEEGYIEEVHWSPDGSEIAVTIGSHLRDRVGIFDLEKSEFRSVTPFCSSGLSVHYAEDGDLYIICCDASTLPDAEGYVTALFPVDYDVYRVREGEILWKTTLMTTSVVSQTGADIIPSEDKELRVTIGSSIFRLSMDGSVLSETDAGGTTADVFRVSAEEADIILADGQYCVYDPTTSYISLVRVFPSGFSDIQILSAGPCSGSYVILRDGNISFYSQLFDENVRYWEGEGFDYAPLSSLRNEDKLLLYVDDRFLFYDTASEALIADLTLNDGSPYHLLTILDGTAYALRVDPPTSRFVLCGFDLATGVRTDETILPVTEFYASLGLTYSEPSYVIASLIDTLYLPPSPVAVRGDLLCLHDWDDPNRILICDLSEGSSREIRADLSENEFLISAGADISPAVLLISEDGERVFSVRYDANTGDINPVMISLADGSVVFLEKDLNDLNSVVFCDGKLLYSGKDSLHVCAQDGSPIYDIPFSGDNATSFYSRDDRIYCVFPGGTLTIFREGTAERTVSLGLSENEYINGKAYRYLFAEDRLYLFCDHDLSVVSLASDSTTPLYTLIGSVIDVIPESHKIICYGLSREKADGREHLASFTEYSVEELAGRSREQWNTFLLRS